MRACVTLRGGPLHPIPSQHGQFSAPCRWLTHAAGVSHCLLPISLCNRANVKSELEGVFGIISALSGISTLVRVLTILQVCLQPLLESGQMCFPFTTCDFGFQEEAQTFVHGVDKIPRSSGNISSPNILFFKPHV